MARTNKTGIDYFPFDVDFFNDEKIEFTSARFGIKGEIIAIRLLCKIYRNGYYTDWNEDESTLLAKRAGDGITPSLVSEIVKELVKRGFFDESLLNRFKILTSKGIQNRYFEAAKRYKTIDVFSEFLLVDVSKMDNVNINAINDDINNNNAYINQQKKRKGKEKEIEKENENENVKFAEFVSMTNAEYQALVTEHSEYAAKEFIKILDNYKGASGKKYKSDYRAILNWVIDRFYEQEKKKINGNNTRTDADKIGAAVGRGNYPNGTYPAGNNAANRRASVERLQEVSRAILQ